MEQPVHTPISSGCALDDQEEIGFEQDELEIWFRANSFFRQMTGEKARPLVEGFELVAWALAVERSGTGKPAPLIMDILQYEASAPSARKHAAVAFETFAITACC